MALIRICYAADLPGPEEALKAIQRGEGVGGGAPSGGGSSAPSGGGGGLRAVAGGGGGYAAHASVRPVAQPDAAVMLQTFDDVVKLIEAKRDVTLKLDVQRYVRLVDFKPGVISFEPAAGAPANLSQRLSARLREWTGQRWMMDLQVGGAETAYEVEQKAARAARQKIESDPFVVAMMEAFPGSEIVGMTFKPVAQPEAQASDEDGADD